VILLIQRGKGKFVEEENMRKKEERKKWRVGTKLYAGIRKSSECRNTRHTRMICAPTARERNIAQYEY